VRARSRSTHGIALAPPLDDRFGKEARKAAIHRETSVRIRTHCPDRHVRMRALGSTPFQVARFGIGTPGAVVRPRSMDHILLLEDEVALRNSILRCLCEARELEITATGSVREALASLNQSAPNLLLADLDLPDGSGLDLLPELSVRGFRIPIVIISGHLTRFRSELPNSPNIDVFAKPFDIVELKHTVLQRLDQQKEAQASVFTVADYLQLAGMARRSIVLTVSDGAQGLGQIIVQNGVPRWAEDQLGEGEAAFRRLALLARSEVCCQPLEVPWSKSNLVGSLEHLLLDAARSADEATRSGNASEKSAAGQRGNNVSALAAIVQRSPLTPAPGQPPLNVAPSGRSAKAPPLPPRPGGERARSSPTLATPYESEPTQESTVNSIKHVKNNLAQILTLDPTLRAAARANRQGSVLDLAGEMDAETACAAATMAARDVGDAAAELGLGRTSAWHVAVGSLTWYVAQSRDELVVAQGGVNKSPMVVLRKLARSLEA
jgi:FixJ family two-component response regulator